MKVVVATSGNTNELAMEYNGNSVNCKLKTSGDNENAGIEIDFQVDYKELVRAIKAIKEG